MQVVYQAATERRRPSIYMEPENERDHIQLRRILNNIPLIAGMGRDANTGKLLHVSIYAVAD